MNGQAKALEAQSAELDRLFIEAESRVDALAKGMEKPAGLVEYERRELDQLRLFIEGLRTKRQAVERALIALPGEIQAAEARAERVRQQSDLDRADLRKREAARRMISVGDVEALLRDLLSRQTEKPDDGAETGTQGKLAGGESGGASGTPSQAALQLKT